MIDISEFKNKLFPAEGLDLNLHNEAKILGIKKTNINAEFSTSIFEGLEFAFPSHKSTFFFFFKTMNSLFFLLFVA